MTTGTSVTSHVFADMELASYGGPGHRRTKWTFHKQVEFMITTSKPLGPWMAHDILHALTRDEDTMVRFVKIKVQKLCKPTQ